MKEKIEIRISKHDKKNFLFADILEEVKHDCRYIIPLWKWKLIKFILGIF